MRYKWLVLLLVTLGLAGCSTAAPIQTPTFVPSTVAPPTATPAAPTVTAAPSTRTPAPTVTVAPPLTPTLATSALPPGFEKYSVFGFVKRDITYCTDGDTALKLDLYLPKTFSGKPMPTLIFFHGHPGEKGGVYPLVEFLNAGYIVADANFREPPDFKVPDSIQDAKCAVRFLRDAPAAYSIDSERIGGYGCSYGSFLTSFLALTEGHPEFEGNGGHTGRSSRLQAAVDLSGITDWPPLAAKDADGGVDGTQYMFGKSPDDPILAKSSPIAYVSKNAPPILIIHGDSDGMVPLEQSQELYDKLQAAGAPATLKIVEFGGHCPGSKEITQAMVDFFAQTLK